LDAYERWVSDDGTQYWDGREWQPIAAITGYPMYTVQAQQVAGADRGALFRISRLWRTRGSRPVRKNQV
jgi:hypothetical protein